MNAHSNPIDRTGRHRAPRQNPLRVAQAGLRALLDRVSGESPHADHLGHPRNDDLRRCCGTPFDGGHRGTCELSAMSTGVLIPGDDWPDPCPGCGQLVAVGGVAVDGQWCQDCVDAADAEPLGQFTGDTQ